MLRKFELAKFKELFKKIHLLMDGFLPELGESWLLHCFGEGDEKSSCSKKQHENRILGIIVGLHYYGIDKANTTDINDLYNLLYKPITNSTISTNLNQLSDQNALTKEREGRLIYYYINQELPQGNPFWIVRNFCIFPSYMFRAIPLVHIYFDGSVKDDSIEKIRRFIIFLCVFKILENRANKCSVCQFSTKEYNDMYISYSILLKERIDTLPKTIKDFISSYGEMPLFNGKTITLSNEELNRKFIDIAERYQQDIEFQLNILSRRIIKIINKRVALSKKLKNGHV